MKRFILGFFTLLLGASLASPIIAAGYERPQPTKPLTFGKTVLGGVKPVVCVPLTAETKDAILNEAKTVASLKPDMVEVRADFWDCIENTDEALQLLRQVDEILGDVPILLTVRNKNERGHKDVSESAKFNFYKGAAKDKLADLIDIELAYGPEKIKAIKQELNQTPIVVAYHDLNVTPSQAEIQKIMEQEIAAGGDVAKIVVKPNSEEDVLTFLNSTLAFRRNHPEYPIIASGSGDIGRITRLIGGLNGIDLTFASGVKGSNPTQMPVAIVQDMLEVIYPETK